MKCKFFAIAALMAMAVTTGLTANAATVAHWRWETGPANTNVIHTIGAGQFEGTIADVSGNGNSLSVWEQGGGAGYQYREDVPYTTLPLLNQPNNFSVKNTGGGPAMFTDSAVSAPAGINAETITPTTFTIEASYKPENGGHRTVVGRDAQNVVTGNGALAALYLQVRPDNSVGIAFTDLAGNFHEAFSPAGLIDGFDFGSDPDGLTGNWYNLAGVSDGTNLKMYVNNALVATTPIVSTDAGLAVGTTSGGDWHAGEWSVGRGLFNGGHGDRAYGYIDEVRISDAALTPAQFLIPTALSLQVDTSTGAVTLKNDAAVPVNVDTYTITSAAGALSLAGWNSLDDQNFSAVDGPDAGTVAGNSPGEGWDQAGGSNANQLIEQFISGAGSTIAANQTLSLGNAFNPAILGSGVDGDLVFNFGYNGGPLIPANVTYVGGGGGPDGDFDNDNDVDGNDFLVWQRGLGGPFNAGDLADWRANFGAGGATAAVGAVPEPSSIVLMLAAGLLLAARRAQA